MKYSYIFLLDKEKDKSDAKIRLRVKWGNNLAQFNVGFRADIDKWVKETQRCKANTTHGKKKVAASTINREIQRLENIVGEIFDSFGKNEPTADEFRFEYNKRNGKAPKSDKTIFAYYDEFILTEARNNSWSLNTIKEHKTTRRHLEEFAPKLEFCDLNERGLTLFVDYLFSLTDSEGNPLMRNTTIRKHISTLKWFLRWATKIGATNENAYIAFVPRLKIIPKKVIFLTWDELMAIYNLEIPESKNYIKKVRDMFLFSCFTSLRYSDVEALKWSNVSEDHIDVVTIKTFDRIRIELNDYSKEILARYERNSGFVFGRISNQKANKYLKELGELAGIDTPVTQYYYQESERVEETKPKYELITTHVGRRTFICNALMLGIAPNIVMKWTGHSDYKAMRPYIDIADEAKANAMRLFNK